MHEKTNSATAAVVRCFTHLPNGLCSATQVALGRGPYSGRGSICARDLRQTICKQNWDVL